LLSKHCAETQPENSQSKDDKHLAPGNSKSASDRFGCRWFVSRYRRKLGRKKVWPVLGPNMVT
jgi:hypothetical protein